MRVTTLIPLQGYRPLRDADRSGCFFGHFYQKNTALAIRATTDRQFFLFLTTEKRN
ncbi:MAG: hypothetical protein LBC10_04750 [Deltaproteobacteria bacterium]|jgi:hypothetical protein|nr:hypothetical protein [Deltaproteobacteria bacterium]